MTHGEIHARLDRGEITFDEAAELSIALRRRRYRTLNIVTLILSVAWVAVTAVLWAKGMI